MGNSISNSNSNSNSLDLKQANKMIKNGKFDLVLDVRSKQEYLQGHYSTSINIPSDTITKKFSKKYPNKEIKILVHCASGFRAANIANVLKSYGYTNVYSLKKCGYEGLTN